MLCINYYSTDAVKFPFTLLNHPGMPKSALGWDIDPEGFHDVLKRFWELFRLPIYVTENGICDHHDELRPSFILYHVYQMHRAVSAGVRVEGYLHWTTMDNFEYAEGYSARFGLVHVDHASRLKRMTIKKSGRLFGEIAKANGITEAIIKKYQPDWRPK
jgi:beta-glucosidase/6-phospho-beta-glucosidase/beta-galactosidase